MRTTKNICFGGVLLACLGSASISMASDLHIGDTIPSLKVDRWMKGTPVPRFEKGKIYVVEFWATWCGPCRQAMPHLSELAKKYAGKVTFIGVDIWEDQHSKPGENLKAKADKFVVQMGDRMSYNVCAGSDDGYMSKNWMTAAGQSGIPATFVVGKDSTLQWIGHPIDLDETISQIVNDKYDVNAFATKTNPAIDKAKGQEALGLKFYEPVDEALKANNFDLAIKAADDAMAKCPKIYKFGLAMKKFETIAKHRPGLAYAAAMQVESDPDQRWMASEVYSMTPNLDKRCYRYALAFFLEKYKDQPNNFAAPAHYAYTYRQLGESKKAAEFFQQYVDGLTKAKVDPVTLEASKKELLEFKEAANKSSN